MSLHQSRERNAMRRSSRSCCDFRPRPAGLGCGPERSRQEKSWSATQRASHWPAAAASGVQAAAAARSGRRPAAASGVQAAVPPHGPVGGPPPPHPAFKPPPPPGPAGGPPSAVSGVQPAAARTDGWPKSGLCPWPPCPAARRSAIHFPWPRFQPRPCPSVRLSERLGLPGMGRRRDPAAAVPGAGLLLSGLGRARARAAAARRAMGALRTRSAAWSMSTPAKSSTSPTACSTRTDPAAMGMRRV